MFALRRVRDHIDRHYAEPIVLDDLARLAGISRLHLIRAFNKLYGETPGKYLSHQTATRDFYCRHLGFEPRVDATMGEFRWVTAVHRNQPELEATFMIPGPPFSPEAAAYIRGQLEAGQMGGLGLRVDDCRKTYAELSAAGVTFIEEPAERPYGVEAVMRDNTGNWLSPVERNDVTAF